MKKAASTAQNLPPSFFPMRSGLPNWKTWFIRPVESLFQKIIVSTGAPFVIIEAIKLLESGLAKECDSIWMVQVPLETQVARVMRHAA